MFHRSAILLHRRATRSPCRAPVLRLHSAPVPRQGQSHSSRWASGAAPAGRPLDQSAGDRKVHGMSSVPTPGTTAARHERHAAVTGSLSAVADAMDRLDAELRAPTGSTGSGIPSDLRAAVRAVLSVAARTTPFDVTLAAGVGTPWTVRVRHDADGVTARPSPSPPDNAVGVSGRGSRPGAPGRTRSTPRRVPGCRSRRGRRSWPSWPSCCARARTTLDELPCVKPPSVDLG